MTLSAVLLAGGESRRMGRDKAQVLFGDESLWQRQIRTLRELQPQTLYVSARARPAWLPAGTEFVMDEPPSRGPLSGIAAALERTVTSHLVTLAIDMPFITTIDLLSLVAKVRTNYGIVPMIDERAEPLAAIYPKDASVDCAAALQSSDTSLQKLVKQLAKLGKIELMYLPPDMGDRYLSLNTPADLHATG